MFSFAFPASAIAVQICTNDFTNEIEFLEKRIFLELFPLPSYFKMKR